MYTLVVVDMQSTFEAANNKRVRNNCKREILQAIESNASIIFVEYIGEGPTIPSLVRLTDDYDRVFIVRKSTDDGSREVRKVIKDNKLPNRQIKVCGVNTDCCVADTVWGLAHKIKSAKIEVIPEACNSDNDHTYGLYSLQKFIVRKK